MVAGWSVPKVGRLRIEAARCIRRVLSEVASISRTRTVGWSSGSQSHTIPSTGCLQFIYPSRGKKMM